MATSSNAIFPPGPSIRDSSDHRINHDCMLNADAESATHSAFPSSASGASKAETAEFGVSFSHNKGNLLEDMDLYCVRSFFEELLKRDR